MNSTEYKKYHEGFMQNNHGTTSVHVFFCIFFTVQSSIYILIKQRHSSFSQCIYEYLILVLPMVMAHTILADHIYALNFLVFTILLYHLLMYKNGFKKFNTKNAFPNDRIPLISALRGLTYLITGLAILAVDFRDFPRYLAKTERFGYSLMDTGVGLFVTMSGIAHKDLCKNSFKDIVKGNVKIITILLVLGVGRFVSVKLLNYQEHITEYGVHWNFFFTIAVCKTISTILLYLYDHTLLLSIITLICHESLLYTGLENWVFSETPRDSLISANREGITSCLGFVSIYLFAVHIRQILMNKDVTKFATLMQLVRETLLLWILTNWHLILPTSRTLANAGYCIFMDTILTTITMVMYFITVLIDAKNDQISSILSTVNTNGLSYFLIANLFTGAVNLSVRTLFVSSSVTFIILNVYMVVTLALVGYVKKLGFKV